MEQTIRVVGIGWKVIIMTNRKANLVGFDWNHARKERTSIVDTAVVRLQDGKRQIIRSH
jgi:hypothetical protein